MKIKQMIYGHGVPTEEKMMTERSNTKGDRVVTIFKKEIKNEDQRRKRVTEVKGKIWQRIHKHL